MSLPDKPSELILVALQDLEKVEKDPLFNVNMSEWVFYNSYTHRCHVCLAGAVMMKTLEARGYKLPRDAASISPSNFGFKEYQSKLLALDSFRLGDVGEGLEEMGLFAPQLNYCYTMPSYNNNPEKFKRRMRAMSRMLRAHGL